MNAKNHLSKMGNNVYEQREKDNIIEIAAD